MELTLETSRLILRPFAIGDIPAVLEISTRPNVSRYMSDMIFDTPEKAEAWIRMLDRICDAKVPRVVLAIVLKDEMLPIGYIGIHPKDTLDDEVEILYAMADEHQNKGYVTEAGKALITWCFAATSVPFLAAIVQHSNKASAKVAEKLGYMYVGDKTLHHDGHMTEFHYYRLYTNK